MRSYRADNKRTFTSKQDAVTYLRDHHFYSKTDVHRCSHNKYCKWVARVVKVADDTDQHVIAFSPDENDDGRESITTIMQHDHYTEGKLTRSMREYLRPFILDVKPTRACFLLRKRFPVEGESIDVSTVANHKKYIKRTFRSSDYVYDLNELRDWVTTNQEHVLSAPEDIVSLNNFFIQIASRPVIEFRKKYNKSHFRTVLLDTTFKLCTMRNVYCVVESSVDAYQRHVLGSVTLTTSLETPVYEKVLRNSVAATGLSAQYTISDGEKAIANAFSNVFPGSRHITCLFHRTFGLLKTSAKYENLSKLQINALSADIARVCKSSSRERFENGFEAFMDKWGKFEPNVRKLFTSEFDGLYDLEPGVPRTTACLERFNLTLKDSVTDHKYLPLIELMDELKEFLLVMEAPKLTPPPDTAYLMEECTPKYTRERLNRMHRAAHEMVLANRVVQVSRITDESGSLQRRLDTAVKLLATAVRILASDPLNQALVDDMMEKRATVSVLKQAMAQNTDPVERVHVNLKDIVGDFVWFDNPDYGRSSDPIMKATMPKQYSTSATKGCDCDDYVHYAVCEHWMALKIITGTMDTTGYSNVEANKRYSSHHRRGFTVPPALVRD